MKRFKILIIVLLLVCAAMLLAFLLKDFFIRTYCSDYQICDKYHCEDTGNESACKSWEAHCSANPDDKDCKSES